jgi:HAD superfamily hydrolase (TIGR01509 family)
MPSRYAAIIMDIDGTFADTVLPFEEADVAYFRERHNLTLTRDHFDRIYIDGWNILNVIMEEHGISKERHGDIFLERIANFTDHMATRARLYPDGFHTLQALHTMFPLAAVTSGRHLFVDFLDRNSSFKQFIQTIVAHEDVKQRKPHPEGLLLAAQRLNVSPHECLYVGDLPSDKTAAFSAGMDFLLVKREHTPKGTEEGVTHVVENFAEVLGVVGFGIRDPDFGIREAV